MCHRVAKSHGASTVQITRNDICFKRVSYGGMLKIDGNDMCFELSTFGNDAESNLSNGTWFASHGQSLGSNLFLLTWPQLCKLLGPNEPR